MFDFPLKQGNHPRTAQKERTRKRPPFLLTQPEKITVIAEVPEGPPARFTWRRVLHCIVKAEGPERIAPEWWQSLRSVLSRRSSVAAADERLAAPYPMEAVHTIASANDQDRIRDYYILEDDSGVGYWVFRSGLYQRETEDGPPAWYMHGLFG